MSKKELKLSADAFTVNEQGEVVINSEQLAEALNEAGEARVGEQGLNSTDGIKVSVSIT